MSHYKGAVNGNWRDCGVPDGFTVAVVGIIALHGQDE